MRTPHSTNTVSRQQPLSNVCNGELGSLCSYARKACILFSHLPSLFFTGSLFLHAYQYKHHTRGKKVLPALKCHDKLLKVDELLHYARKASVSSFLLHSISVSSSVPFLLECSFSATLAAWLHGWRCFLVGQPPLSLVMPWLLLYSTTGYILVLTVAWLATKFGAVIRVPLRINCNNFCDPPTFSPVSSTNYDQMLAEQMALPSIQYCALCCAN